MILQRISNKINCWSMVLFSKNLAIKSHPIKTPCVSEQTRDFTICWKSSESTLSSQRTAHTDVRPSYRETWILCLSQNRAWLTCMARACSLLQSQTAGLDIGNVQVVGFPFHRGQPHLWGIQDTENLISRRATGRPPSIHLHVKTHLSLFSSYNFPFVCFQNHRRPP